MNMLLNDEFIPAVKAGTKRSTVRKGVRSIELGAMCRLQGEHDYADVSINGTTFKLFDELDSADAIRDGFESVDELRRVLTEIYGPLDGEYMTIIRFGALPS